MIPRLTKAEKRQFNSCIYYAQISENKKEFHDCLKHYQEALAIFPYHDKLPIKIEQIKQKLNSISSPVQESDLMGFIYDKLKNSFYLPRKYFLNADIFKKLMPHQRYAVKWLWDHHCNSNMSGCILGDDMGLGKTIEILAFINGLVVGNHNKSFLLVVPAMVVKQWENEAKTWCSNVSVNTVHGKKAVDRKAAICYTNKFGGILLTTYNLAQNDEELIGDKTWDYIILDEAHVIRNKSAKVTIAMKSFRAKHKISATGTPMMNNLSELWNMMDYTMDRRLLGEHKYFVDRYERSITKANLKDENSTAAKARLKELSSIIVPHVLRRTKKDVFGDDRPNTPAIDMVDENDSPSDQQTDLSIKVNKYELVVWVHLDQNQRKIYEYLLDSINIKDLQSRDMKIVLWMIGYLEKVCSNPPAIKDTLNKDNESFLTPNLIKLVEKETVAFWPKLFVLLKLLKSFEKNNFKCLLFSQYKRTLDSIQDFLISKDIPYYRIDGSIDVKLRRDILHKFNNSNSWCVLLMTIKVGACGLNIVGANRVIIFDEGWSVIGNQAVDRVYRIGQTKDVVTYRIVSCGTMEEKMYRRQVHKTTLTDLALETENEKQKFRHWFTRDELFALFDKNQLNFDTSNTHDLFQRNIYVFGVSDHNFIIKTDLPENEQKLVNVPVRSIPVEQSFVGQRLPSTKKMGLPIGEVIRRKEHDGDINGEDRLKATAQNKNKKSTCCYFHGKNAFPFLVLKCRCHCTSDELNDYNKFVNRFNAETDIVKRLMCLIEMVKICDDDKSLHLNIVVLSKQVFK
ncbi:Non-specific serine/threonine protein kinase [Entamoeba marina]